MVFPKLSEFTLAVLEDSGWYVVNYSQADNITWGKNQGCDFFYNKCNGTNFREFCTVKEEKGCSFDKGGRARCIEDKLADHCKYMLPYNNQFCKEEKNEFPNDFLIANSFGPNSICVESNMKFPNIVILETPFPKHRCNKFECRGENKTDLYLTLFEEDIKCSTKEEKIETFEHYKGYVICPDPAEMCPAEQKPVQKRKKK